MTAPREFLLADELDPTGDAIITDTEGSVVAYVESRADAVALLAKPAPVKCKVNEFLVVVILALLALRFIGCASSPQHVATVVSASVQSSFQLAKTAEQAAFDAGLLTIDQHYGLLVELKQAFKLHEDAAKLIRGIPDGGTPPAEYAQTVAQALVLIQDVLAALPASPAKAQAVAAASKGFF